MRASGLTHPIVRKSSTWKNEYAAYKIDPEDLMKSDVLLRDVVESDLPIFFEHQLDPDAIHMAAFTVKDPADPNAFQAHWAKIMGDEKILIKTILYQGDVAGYVLSYEQFGEREVSYWLGKDYWKRGIATAALRQYLVQVRNRPLYARAAKDNIGSIRVLEKCGFSIIGEDKGFSNARGKEVEEFLLKLGGTKR